jgi:hypothetical protein
LTPINTERREDILARRHEEHKEERSRKNFNHGKHSAAEQQPKELNAKKKKI